MAPCELCLAMGGRYQMTRKCCQVRLLATMPAHARKAAYDNTRATEGATAMQQLQALVAAEWKRLKAARTATGAAALANIKNLMKGAVPA